MKIIKILALSLLFTACGDFEREIDLDLPKAKRELVVECYIRPGEPYTLLLTENKGYFDDLNECPMVRGALVVIEHDGRKDTLQEAPYLGECTLTNPNFIPFFDATRSRFYNYGSNTICPLSYDKEFKLYINDAAGGRSVTATCKTLPVVPITQFIYTWNADSSKASAFLKAMDDGATVDFYRIQMHKRYVYKPDSATNGFFNVQRNPEFDNTLDDARLFNGREFARGTGFDYKNRDTLIATVYHIEKSYHDYLETLRDSEGANGNPFSQPPTIISNIQGGKGIFASFLFDRDTIVVTR